MAVDKLLVTSGALFLLADIFAMVALVVPDWINWDDESRTTIGLLNTCLTLRSRDTICYKMDNRQHPQWLLVFVFIILSILCLHVTIALLIASRWRREVIFFAKWLSFTAMWLFSLSAIIFPIGFSRQEIGGEPFQLPSSFKVGVSYIFFVFSLWMTAVGIMFVGRLCTPVPQI